MATPATALSLDFSRVFLQNPVSLRLFTRFLEGEFSQENLLFWLAVEDFKNECSRCQGGGGGKRGGGSEHHHKLLTRAKEIFEKYISGTSEYAVNLGYNVVQSVQEKMASLHQSLTQHHHPHLHPQTQTHTQNQTPQPNQQQAPLQFYDIACDMFGEAQDNVFQLMKMDSYPRFIKSDIYLELLQFRGHLDSNQRHPLEQMVSEGFMHAAERQDGWDDVKEQDGVIISRKKVADIYCMRGVGIVEAPPSVVYDLVSDVSKRKQWDELYCAGHEVERLDNNLVVYYMSWNSPNKLAFNRDFVVLRVVRENKEEGSFLCASKSVAHPDVPARQGFVRGEMESSGFIIRPCGPSQSLVVYLAQIDPKGKIPKTIENYVSQQRPMCIAKIRRLLQERKNDVKPTRSKMDEDQWRGASSSRRMNRVSVYVPNSRIFNIANNVTDINVGANVAELMNNFNGLADFSNSDANPAGSNANLNASTNTNPTPDANSSNTNPTTNPTPTPSTNSAPISVNNDSNDSLNILVTPTIPSSITPSQTNNNGADDSVQTSTSPFSGDSTKSNSKLDISHKPNDNNSPTSKSNSKLNLDSNTSPTSKSNSKLNLSSSSSDDLKTSKSGSKLNLQSSGSSSSIEGDSDNSQATKKSNSKLNVSSGNNATDDNTTKKSGSKLLINFGFGKGDDEKAKKSGSKLNLTDQSSNNNDTDSKKSNSKLNLSGSNESDDSTTKKSNSKLTINVSNKNDDETTSSNTSTTTTTTATTDSTDPNTSPPTTPTTPTTATTPTTPSSPTPTTNNATTEEGSNSLDEASSDPKQNHGKPQKRPSKLSFFGGEKKSKSQSSLPTTTSQNNSNNKENNENSGGKGSGLWHKATKRFQSTQKHFLDTQ